MLTSKESARAEWVINHQDEDDSWGDITEEFTGNYVNTLLSLNAAADYVTPEKRDKAKDWINTFSGNRWLDRILKCSYRLKGMISIAGAMV